MELLRLKCPVCHSSDMQYHSPYTTKNHGGRVIYKCANCPVYFSETKNTLMEGLKTPMSVIWHVIKARTEGMGLNAAARTFDKAKNTILAWERKFVDLHRVLFLYALVIGKYLSCLRKLNHVIAPKEGFETQLRASRLPIPFGMRALGMTR